MDRDRLDAHFVAGAVDSKRDLAAIGDQDLLDRHLALGFSMITSGLVELDRLGVDDEHLASRCRRAARRSGSSPSSPR
jgi:hypothetical protein